MAFKNADLKVKEKEVEERFVILRKEGNVKISSFKRRDMIKLQLVWNRLFF